MNAEPETVAALRVELGLSAWQAIWRHAPMILGAALSALFLTVALVWLPHAV